MSINKLKNIIESEKNIVIAIDGPSGSGKSTLASELESLYDVLVFHTDDYFLHPSRKTSERLDEPGGNLDYERMFEEIFMHLNEDYINSHHFNCMTNELEERKPYRRKSVIIIEGVYAMHPKFIGFYDYKVFLEVEPAVQQKRILNRSNDFMLNRFNNEWIPLENLYFDTFSIREKADLIIKN